MFAQDAVHHGQAQAGARANRLGREEGFEHAPERVLRDAAAVVHHLQADTGARPRVGVRQGLQAVAFPHGLGLFDVLKPDLNARTGLALHGLQGVGGEVEHDLLELCGIGHDRRQGGRHVHVQCDFCGQCGPEHEVCFCDDGTQTRGLACAVLPSPEGQDLLHQVARAPAGLRRRRARP